MQRLSAPERTREELRALMNGELGDGAGTVRIWSAGAAADRGGSAGGRGSRPLGRERYERGEGEARAATATATGRAR